MQVRAARVRAKSPADMCGLRDGDRIVAVDGTALAALIQSGPLAQAVAKVGDCIRGAAGSNVTLEVERGGEVEVDVGGGVRQGGRRGRVRMTVSVMRGQRYESPRAAPVVLIVCISADRCRAVADSLRCSSWSPVCP